MANLVKSVLLVLVNVLLSVISATCDRWDHAVDMDDNYRLLWSISNQDITFEVQARTLGYIGLGFSRDGTIYGADIVIGWVDNGQVHFQDRHFKRNSDGEPLVDPAQDYVLLLGYENATHTVLRFRRKLDTCDINHDVAITNDTIKVIFMYHNEDPMAGRMIAGSLPDPNNAVRGIFPIFLTQRVNQVPIGLDSRTKALELRNQNVKLPENGENLNWCKMFKLNDFVRKNHIVRYEPVFDTKKNIPFIQHITLYECQGSSPELEIISREHGSPCQKVDRQLLNCNSIVASWSRGSEGFTFPSEAGYPLDSYHARFYLMATHYSSEQSNSIEFTPRADNSGLRFYHTSNVRKYDAGVMSIGMDPSWRHIIPPGQERVISEGHCVEECTQRAFPRPGINIFAVMMKSNHMGKQIKLRQVRQAEELIPIAHDMNIDSNYQEYRRLGQPAKVLPGDRLIAECTYDSSDKDAITLGGSTVRDEQCLVLSLYYPRQKELTTCHSIPSLPTVLHSLGINELEAGSNPVRISSPPELAGVTLESRLLSYNWQNNFNLFDRITRKGSFKPICLSARYTPIPGTDNIESYAPNVTKIWRKAPTCSFNGLASTSTYYKSVNRYVTESETNADIPPTEDVESNTIEGAASSKMFFFNSSSKANSSVFALKFLLFVIFINSFRLF